MNQLVEDLDVAHRELRAALDAVDLDAATPAGWTAKEMAAHVAFWLECVDPVVNGMHRGRVEIAGWRFGSGYVADAGWPDADTHNAREAAWARDRSADAVLDRLDRATARAAVVLSSVTDDERAANPRYYAEIAAHLREHTEELSRPGG